MEFAMSVGGNLCPGAGSVSVLDPATLGVVAQAPCASERDVDLAARSAEAAFADWASAGVTVRAEALRACGAVLHGRAEELAALLTAEQGKPLRDARSEVRLGADWFGWTADLAALPETLIDEPGRTVVMDRVPHGPVAAIAPFNFPVILAITKIAPALLAGNTVVVKPSPATPLTTLRIGELLHPLLPPGVLNVVNGGPDVGAALAAHPLIRLVSFTGSVPTGRAIARGAAEAFKRTVLELGGNDACVILPDADIPALAERVFAAAMVNSGQFCAAVKRVYVAEHRRSEVVALLADLARSERLGPGHDEASRYGPLTTRAQWQRVRTLVAAAEKAGAWVIPGDVPTDAAGYFHPLTVVTDLPSASALEIQEQFGPVIPVIGYRSIDEAVEAANSTEFGLGGSVWGAEGEAAAVASRLTCGTAWVNTHGDLHPNVPFGGTGSSGMGVEYGHCGLLEYTRIRVSNIMREVRPDMRPAGEPQSTSAPADGQRRARGQA